MSDDCILWQGARDKDGHGTLNVQGKKMQAHRHIYMQNNEEDITNKVIRHMCDNPPCVNPNHLKAGTHQDNSNDMVARGRQRKAKGELNTAAKLTRDNVYEIRSLLVEGAAVNAIAKKYGVGTTTIYAIKTGQNWGWLN